MAPSDPASGPSLSYRDAGVDIDAGNRLVEQIKPIVGTTRRPEVLAGLGGFGGLFELPLERYRRPVLVSGTDGVGTKLRLAIASGRHDTIGIDLVAMCVNDVLVQGAEPLFFLDYYATGALDVARATQVIAGIAEGCRQAGAALIGGETAEMPGMYHGADYDLAGFCVGVVERDRLITGAAVRPGDRAIALASSGPHSNGYSLIRRVLEASDWTLDQELHGRSLADWLLAPTRIYVRSVLPILDRLPVHAIAHITGGGLPENLPRVLPQGTALILDRDSWQWPEIFRWLQQEGNIAGAEMLRTFNCGVGMVLILPPEAVEQALAELRQAGEDAWLIGSVVASAEAEPTVRLEAGA